MQLVYVGAFRLFSPGAKALLQPESDNLGLQQARVSCDFARMFSRHAVLVLALVWTAGALAQEGKDDEYQRAVRDALQEYQSTNFAEAYALFGHAHQLRPGARTWRCLGMTSFELRQYVRARDELREALNDSRQPLTSEQRVEVSGLLERIAHYVATVEVHATPKSAVVTLDGEPLQGQRAVNLGEHELAVRAEGYEPAQRKLVLEGGKAQTLAIELTPLPAPAPREVAVPAQALQPTAAARETPLVERWWFWTALGVVVAGSAAAIVAVSIQPEEKKPEPGTVGDVIEALRGRP
ncbi:MAG TPA: PEGA domain-containing protein [Polyangiales bacterium]|nr:PEGA domain-containing protein [Polyangiales bacterium]